jgi:serine/threonine-protein kinase
MQITKAVSLLKPLSSGGMGAVWLADHLGLKTRVVVKFMLGELGSSETMRTRFSREAAAAAQVKSPHVVHMLDHGVSDDGVPFIVMEHLEGHDLGAEIEAHGALDPVKVVMVVSQIAKALSKVHAAGLLHRDIKPDNIFLVDGEDDVFAKLLDFGIAKSSDASEGAALDAETKTGQVVGTPFYMSPEQVTAQKSIDSRADLWALGVVAYEALTGKRPYDGPSFGALAVRIATGEPPKPSADNPSLPPQVDAWFAKACARDASARFATAKEMADAFRASFEGVFSLPSSDSGQRGVMSTRSGSGSGSMAPSPTLGLAKTALDDSGVASKQVALGSSAAGVSVTEGGRTGQRTSPLLYLAGAGALLAGLGSVFLFGVRSKDPPESIRPAPAATASIAASPSAPLTAIPSMSAPAAVAPVAPDAGPTHAPGGVVVRPAPQPRANGGVAPKHSATDPTPRPTAKPASAEPDLF